MAKVMLVDILAYRDWAKNLAYNVRSYCEENNIECDIHGLYNGYHMEADITFLVGWSEIVPLGFYQDRMVLVLHPSPLPLYRGGSPIQHQILSGEKESKVTLFKLDKNHPKVDSGPIHSQTKFSLRGNLSDILSRVSDVGAFLVQDAITEFKDTRTLQLYEQDETRATTFKRRLPDESEITDFELHELTAEQLYNKVRALQDPYPNAFIRCFDGSRLYITQAHL